MSRMVTQNDPNLGVVWVRSLECVNSWLISLHQDCSLLKWASLWAISLGVYFIGGRVCLRSVSNSCRTIRHNFIMLLSVVKRNSSCQTNLKPFSSSSIFLTNCLRFFSKTCINQETHPYSTSWKRRNETPCQSAILETAAPVMSRSVKFKMPPWRRRQENILWKSRVAKLNQILVVFSLFVCYIDLKMQWSLKEVWKQPGISSSHRSACEWNYDRSLGTRAKSKELG